MEKPNPMTPRPEGETMTFEDELRATLNRFSQENASNTPDWILAQFLAGCLAAWNAGVQQRENWYGRDPRPGSPELSTLPIAPGEGTDAADTIKDFCEAVRDVPWKFTLPASAPGGAVGEYRKQQAERVVQDEGAMWSLLRSILSQGKDIHLDYAEKRYEEYSARLDLAARERASDLFAAVRRAAEQGWREALGWAYRDGIARIVAQTDNTLGTHLRIEHEAEYVARGLAALADDEGRGKK